MFETQIIPESDLENLENLVSFLIVQRDLSKPVRKLQRILRDMRLVILNIIENRYNPTSAEYDVFFMHEISDCLAEIRCEIEKEDLDLEYCDYCISEIDATFRMASQIKTANPSKHGLLLDMLILKSFDFHLQPRIKLIKSGGPTETTSI
jgi:hypothetical protein